MLVQKKIAPVSATEELWFAKGVVTTPPPNAITRDHPYSLLILNPSYVQVQINAQETTIRWVMAGANWFSLLTAQNHLKFLKGPFRLEFFNSGWFTEHHPTAKKAIARLDYLMVRSDVRFSSKTFVQSPALKGAKLPEQLRQSFEAGMIDMPFSVTCAVDRNTGRVQVEKIGDHSLLAKLWGQSTISFPCKTGNNYDQIVSLPYFDVIKTGRPTHDHVCAAMIQPNGRVNWVNYQRIIFPGELNAQGNPTVMVQCALAPTDISMW